MAKRLRGTYATDSGMTCLWDPATFAGIHDYGTWESQLLEEEDIRRHIEAGALVPINIKSDGAYEIEVRVGLAAAPAVLSDRETKYMVVASGRYFFRSRGRLCVSGIEHVEKEIGDGVGVIAIPEGGYAIKVHLIGWDDEPGMKLDDGTPKEGALPDFVALVNPSSQDAAKFRVRVDTFPPPG